MFYLCASGLFGHQVLSPPQVKISFPIRKEDTFQTAYAKTVGCKPKGVFLAVTIKSQLALFLGNTSKVDVAHYDSRDPYTNVLSNESRTSGSLRFGSWLILYSKIRYKVPVQQKDYPDSLQWVYSLQTINLEQPLHCNISYQVIFSTNSFPFKPSVLPFSILPIYVKKKNVHVHCILSIHNRVCQTGSCSGSDQESLVCVVMNYCIPSIYGNMDKVATFVFTK